MKLIAYVIDGHHVDIRPAPIEREWMDATNQRFAYRCLPVNIANAHGWEILCPTSFTMNWMLTRRGLQVSFAQGEPFCHVFPVKRGELGSIEPQLRLLSQADLKRPDSQASAERWQKHYYHGRDIETQQFPVEDHRTRLRLRPFTK
jgi:uncharacterized protein DUF6065